MWYFLIISLYPSNPHLHFSEHFTLRENPISSCGIGGGGGGHNMTLIKFQVLADTHLRAPLRTSKSQEHPHLHPVLSEQCHPLWTYSCSSVELSPHNLMLGDCPRSLRCSGMEAPRIYPMLQWECTDFSCWFTPLLHLNHRPRGTLLQESMWACRFCFQTVTVFYSNTSELRQQAHSHRHLTNDLSVQLKRMTFVMPV